MSVRLDPCEALVVVWCDACPWFREAVFTMGAGHVKAAAHEAEFHPDREQARKAADRYRARHADANAIRSMSPAPGYL